MKLDTSRFGSIDVDEKDILTFTHPIIGFQEFRRFVVLPGPENSGLTWLQSTEAADLAFIMMDPKSVMPEYAATLHPHECTELAVQDVSELDVYTLVVVPAEPERPRTNLKAPILVNPRQRLAKQTILEKSDYPVRFVLAQEEASAPEEVSHARSDA